MWMWKGLRGWLLDQSKSEVFERVGGYLDGATCVSFVGKLEL